VLVRNRWNIMIIPACRPKNFATVRISFLPVRSAQHVSVRDIAMRTERVNS